MTERTLMQWLRDNLAVVVAVAGLIYTFALQAGHNDETSRRVTALEAASVLHDSRDQDRIERLARIEANVTFLVQREQGRTH